MTSGIIMDDHSIENPSLTSSILPDLTAGEGRAKDTSLDSLRPWLAY